MCGIAGASLDKECPRDVVRAMTEVLVHRGPDGCGYWQHPGGTLALGHRRLSILDPTPAGRQPMASRSQRLHVTYNGEIYNFRELRAELEQLGHRFSTRSDTEVLLAAWEQWQTGALAKLRGMWAFALWDEAAGELVLVRDRLGIKPLYYTRAGNGILFASEIRSLLASGRISRAVDRQAVWDYMSYGAVAEPLTVLRDVKALPAGHLLRIRKGEFRFEQYWDVAEATYAARALPPLPYVDAVGETRRLLEEAMSCHMISDVPLGAFLSGGIDSTAAVALASRVGGTPVKTFSVGFGGEHRALDELRWAKLVADRFGCHHTEVVLASADVAGLLDRVAHGLDQPSYDGTNTFIVSEAARRDVVVALSGLGGDELFAGYPHFVRYARSTRLAPDGVPALRRIAPVAARLPGRVRIRLDALAAAPAERLTAFRLLMTEADKRVALCREFIGRSNPTSPIERHADYLRSDLDSIAQVSYAELNGYLRNTLLRDADAMSMAHSLEIRPVLLDHRLVEHAFSLPADYKVRGGRTKRILVDALSDLLPIEVVSRRKMGFDLPFHAWLGGPLRGQARDLLETATALTLFTPTFRRKIATELDGPSARPHRLWSVIMLLAFVEAHQVCVTS
jgi:asparagine synthase (glutamine-hydrolysing)